MSMYMSISPYQCPNDVFFFTWVSPVSTEGCHSRFHLGKPPTRLRCLCTVELSVKVEQIMREHHDQTLGFWPPLPG